MTHLSPAEERHRAAAERRRAASGPDAVVTDGEIAHGESLLARLRVEAEALPLELPARERLLETVAAFADQLALHPRTEPASIPAQHVMYFVTSREGRILEASGPAAKILGVPQRSLMGKPLITYIAAAQRRRFRKALADVADGIEPDAAAFSLAPRSGGALVIEASVVPIGDDEDNVLVWALQEVTAQHEAEAELQLLAEELEGRIQLRVAVLQQEYADLAAVLDQLPVGAAILASDGSVELANKLARELGVDAGDVPIPPDGEVVFLERRRPNGESRLVELRAARVRARGRRLGRVLTLVDVTDRARRERAEQEFMSNVAHELRTPLAGITSAVDVLQGGAKEHPDVRDRFLGHLETQCARLNRLVPALLALARAELASDLGLEIVPLEPLLAGVAADLRPAPAVVLDVGCDSGAAVLGSPPLVEQAVWNLAANAERYTTAGAITIRCRLEGPWAVVTVADTGTGIPEADLERVFDRFYRVSADRGGFGLGLAIVRRSAEAMGGDVTLRRNTPCGTIAELRLPAAPVSG